MSSVFYGNRCSSKRHPPPIGVAIIKKPFYHQILASTELGGGELFAVRLAQQINGQSRGSLAWTPGAGPAERFAQDTAILTNRYAGDSAAASNAWSATQANLQFAMALRRYGPGLVHVHSPFVYGALRWGLKLARLPRVVHIHLDYEEAGLRWALRSPPDLIVTCAKFMIEPVRRALPVAKQATTRIEALPNAVDLTRFTPPDDKLRAKHQVNASLDRPFALMLANLAPHKGQETALNAIAELKARDLDVDLWLAGMERSESQAYTTKLRNLIEELRIADRVRMLGQRSDAAELLQAADFFLLPSTHEGLPLSILEAQAARVPVLAAPTAGVPEVIQHDQTGLLISADDAVGYAAGMERLWRQPAYREQIVDQAYSQVSSQNAWSTYCQKMLALYDGLTR